MYYMQSCSTCNGSGSIRAKEEDIDHIHPLIRTHSDYQSTCPTCGGKGEVPSYDDDTN